MAAKHAVYGKDHPERFIEGALEGDIHGQTSPDGFQDTMTSNEMVKHPCDRPHQHILTATALDNVGRVYDRFPTSIRDVGGVRGGPENLKHSLTGVSAVNEDIGAAGHVHETIIPDH